MTELAAGTVLAGHRVASVIGRGGASVVYRARHLQLDRDVALKVLAPQLALDDGFRERFVRESRVAAGLEHPHIVPVYDAGGADGLLYLSMRLIEGPDLGRLLESRGGAISEHAAIEICTQIAGALDAAHRQGLVHRDVKPGNILLERDRDSGAMRAFLSDFGIVKRVDGSTGPTRTGYVVGTADFVAPEQVQGSPVDGRADVYSLACVLYRCLAGAPPFERPSVLATVYAHVHDPPPHLPSSPSALDDVVQRGLAKDPNDRFTTCGDLVRAANAAVEGEVGVGRSLDDTLVDLPAVRSMGDLDDRTAAWPVRVEPDTPPPRSRRPRGAAALVGIVVVAAAIAVAVLVRRPEPSAEPSDGETLAPASPSDTASALNTLMWQRVSQGPPSLRAPGSSALDVDVASDAFTVVGYAGGGSDTDGGVWVSPDAVRWSRVSDEGLVAPEEQRIEGVTEHGSGQLAVGWTYSLEGGVADAAVWRPEDDGEWRLVWTETGAGEQVMRDVVVVDGGLIAAGWDESQGPADAAVWASEDGETWERVADDALGGPGDERIYGIVGTPEGVVAVGNATAANGTTDIAIWTSPDGRSWELQTEERPGYQRLTDVVPSPSGAIAVGVDDDDAAVWIEDGGRWTQWLLPRADAIESNALAAAVIGDGYVIGGWTQSQTGRDAMIWTSPDGLTWTPADPQVPGGADLGGPGDQEIRGLIGIDDAAHGVRVIAVGVSTLEEARAAIWYGTFAVG